METEIGGRTLFWSKAEKQTPVHMFVVMPGNCQIALFLLSLITAGSGFSFLFCKSGRQCQPHDEREMLTLWGMSALP